MKAYRQQNGGLASLTPECLDQLCDLIIAKLEEKNLWGLTSQARRRGFKSQHPLHIIGQRLFIDKTIQEIFKPL